MSTLFWQSDWPWYLGVFGLLLWAAVIAVRTSDRNRSRRHHPTQLRRRQINELTRSDRGEWSDDGRRRGRGMRADDDRHRDEGRVR